MAMALLAWAAAAHAVEVTPLKFFPDQANVIEFAPVDARFVRLNLSQSSSGEGIALDEVEVFAPGKTDNLALAASGAKATASSCVANDARHKVEHLNDGLYRDEHGWRAASTDATWVQIELPRAALIDRVVLSRDRVKETRGRKVARDRMPGWTGVETSRDGKTWTAVSSVLWHWSTGRDLPVPTPQHIAWHERERVLFVCYGSQIVGGKYANLRMDKFDPDQWMHATKAWGAKELLLVCTHPGDRGFAWWPTETNDNNVTKLPWKDGKGNLGAAKK